MAQPHILNINPKYVKTYKTHANAENAMNKVIEGIDEGAYNGTEAFWFIVAATECGRFAPTVMLAKDQAYLMSGFAHAGFKTIVRG